MSDGSKTIDWSIDVFKVPTRNLQCIDANTTLHRSNEYVAGTLCSYSNYYLALLHLSACHKPWEDCFKNAIIRFFFTETKR